MVPEEVVEKYDREMDRRTRQNLERFAEFMARMIEKYGHKVLAEMEREEAADCRAKRTSVPYSADSLRHN